MVSGPAHISRLETAFACKRYDDAGLRGSARQRLGRPVLLAPVMTFSRLSAPLGSTRSANRCDQSKRRRAAARSKGTRSDEMRTPSAIIFDLRCRIVFGNV